MKVKRRYNDSEIQTRSIRREAYFKPDTINSEERTVEVVISTGARGIEFDEYGEPFHEYLSTDPEHIRMHRLENGAAVLDNHHRSSLDDQIGVVENPYIKDGEIRATIRFRSNKKSLEIFKDVEAGIIRNISMGYLVYKYMEIESDSNLRAFLAYDYEIFEVSFCPVHVDAKAGTRSKKEELHITKFRSFDLKTGKENKETKDKLTGGGNPESKPEPKTTDEPEPEPKPEPKPTNDPKPGKTPKESERSIGIIKLCTRGGLGNDYAVELIERGLPLEAAREEIFQKLIDKDPGETINLKISSGSYDERDVRVRSMQNALMHRVDSSTKLEESAYQYRGASLLDIARRCLEADGIKVGYDRSTIATRAMTTADFPEILSNTSNKMLLASYENKIAKQTFTPLVKIGNAPDFKKMKKVRPSESPSFKPLEEDGEIRTARLSENSEEYRISTFARTILISRQAIIDDDLGAFDQLSSFGASAARLESNLVWSILLDNARMGDGHRLFSKEHKNIGEGKYPQGLDIEGLSFGEYIMSSQMGLNEEDFLDIMPKYLIVPSILKTKALSIISDRYMPNEPSKVNPFAGGLEVISEPRLNKLVTVGQFEPWFLAADKEEGLPLVELSFLDGVRRPTIDSRVNFETKGVEVSAIIDCGAKALDWRPLYKSMGKVA